jgi:hypothetical protein
MKVSLPALFSDAVGASSVTGEYERMLGSLGMIVVQQTLMIYALCRKRQ